MSNTEHNVGHSSAYTAEEIKIPCECCHGEEQHGAVVRNVRIIPPDCSDFPPDSVEMVESQYGAVLLDFDSYLTLITMAEVCMQEIPNEKVRDKLQLLADCKSGKIVSNN